MPPFDKEVFRMNYRPLQIFAVCCTPFRCTGRRPGDGVRPGTLSEQRAAAALAYNGGKGKHRPRLPAAHVRFLSRPFRGAGPDRLPAAAAVTARFWALKWPPFMAPVFRPRLNGYHGSRKYAACPQGVRTRSLVSSHSTGMPRDASYSGKSPLPSVMTTISEGASSAIFS